MRITSAAKDATRKRIVHAAQTLFERQGFEATTTRDIARSAKIAAGTLFNYFPSKESIVDHLIGDACGGAEEKLSATLEASDERSTLEEELFAHVAAVLRALKPYRKYLSAVLNTSFSPFAGDTPDSRLTLRSTHLETVTQIAIRYEQHEAMSAIALQLYWTLYTGVLAFWTNDTSPRQEDTLALLDQSLAMFVGWLTDSQPSDLTTGQPSITSHYER